MSPLQHSMDHETALGALKELPPLFRRLLRRMLELFCQGLKLEATSLPTDKQQSTTEHTEEVLNTQSPRSDPKNSKCDDASTALRVALETLGGAEVTARLSAAFVTAVYEHIFLLDPIPADRSDPLLPAAFRSSSNENNPQVFNLTALGCELRIKPS